MNIIRKIKARLNEKGHEVLDPTPIAPPVGYKKQPSLSDQIRDMIRSERLAQEAKAAGYETFEEADDFDIGDDFDPSSPYEVEFDPPAQDPGPSRPEARKPEPAPQAPPAEPKAPPSASSEAT